MSTKQILFEINKTQIDTNINYMNTCLEHITEGYTIKSVSYTHLDVYKRQIYTVLKIQ